MNKNLNAFAADRIENPEAVKGGTFGILSCLLGGIFSIKKKSIFDCAPAPKPEPKHDPKPAPVCEPKKKSRC